jgi:hypothetical protein
MADQAGIPISELVDVTGQCSGPDRILFASYDCDGDPPSDRCRCNRRRCPQFVQVTPIKSS